MLTGSVDSQSMESQTSLSASAESQIPESPSSITASVQSQTSWSPTLPSESVEIQTAENMDVGPASVEYKMEKCNQSNPGPEVVDKGNSKSDTGIDKTAVSPDVNANMHLCNSKQFPDLSMNIQNPKPTHNQETGDTAGAKSHLNEVKPSIIQDTNESCSPDCDTKVLENVTIHQTNDKSSQGDNIDGCCSSKNIVNEQSITIGVPKKMKPSSSQNNEMHNNINVTKDHSGAITLNGIQNVSMDNTTGGKRLSNSSPDLHIPNRDSGSRRCLEKSTSQESNRSADYVPDIAQKSKSHSELRSNSSKESQMTLLFKQVKRVVSNSSAIKNYQMLSNTSLEVLSQNSIDLLSHEGRDDVRPQLSEHKRLSFSSQSSGKSHSDTNSLLIRKLKAQTSLENVGSKLEMGPGLSSPALSTKSLNFPSNERLAESSSDEALFRSRHHSLDKTSKIRPRRRRRPTSSNEQVGATSGGEKNKAVSFQVQTTTDKPSEVNTGKIRDDISVFRQNQL